MPVKKKLKNQKSDKQNLLGIFHEAFIALIN